jgi:hypothetical protein
METPEELRRQADEIERQAQLINFAPHRQTLLSMVRALREKADRWEAQGRDGRPQP